MTEMQYTVLKKMSKPVTPAEMANMVGSYPGPVARCMYSLVNNGWAKLSNNGKFSRTADGSKELKRAN